ncbi:MAG: TrbC/VirB2 family protein [Pseudomonadota bacterium]
MKLTTKPITSFERASLLLAALAVTSLAVPDPALAQGNFQGIADTILGILTGGLARTISVIAVIISGFLFFTGRANWGVFAAVVFGTAIVFSADWVVSLIAGG